LCDQCAVGGFFLHISTRSVAQELLRGDGVRRHACGASEFANDSCRRVRIGDIRIASERRPPGELLGGADDADAEEPRREALPIREQSGDVLTIRKREIIDAEQHAEDERGVLAEHEVPAKLADRSHT
jgi:hypothetical protein